MTFPAGITCTFVTRVDSGTKDAHGNPIYTDTPTPVASCGFAPGDTTELLGDQDTVTADATLYAPTGTAVAAVDAVTVPGYGTFEVLGQAAVWPAHPRTGWQPSNSVVIRLRRVTG